MEARIRKKIKHYPWQALVCPCYHLMLRAMALDPESNPEDLQNQQVWKSCCKLRILPLKILLWMTLEKIAYALQSYLFSRIKYLLLRLDYILNCLCIDECTWHFIWLFLILPQLRIYVEFFLCSTWKCIMMFMWYLNESKAALFWFYFNIRIIPLPKYTQTHTGTSNNSPWLWKLCSFFLVSGIKV